MVNVFTIYLILDIVVSKTSTVIIICYEHDTSLSFAPLDLKL